MWQTAGAGSFTKYYLMHKYRDRGIRSLELVLMRVNNLRCRSAVKLQHRRGQAAQPEPAPVDPPVRGNDRVPLFMRRGTLPTAQSSDGSPSSAGGSSSGSGSSAARFPGFPSGSSSPTQELKRLITPPPGFGPPAISSSGIAGLPRFQ